MITNFKFFLILSLSLLQNVLGEFDENFVNYVHKLSKLSYCAKEDIDAWTCKECHENSPFKDVETYHSTI